MGASLKSDKRIAFRVDASAQIGTGHFMRCLAVADELTQRGAQVRFVSRHLPVHLRDMLVLRGIEFAPLHAVADGQVGDDVAHAQWLGTSQAQDAQDTIQALSDESWDWLVVDHYALDARWETALRETSKSILAIDDIADRRHDCDLLLDQNFHADMETRYIGKVPAHCRLLLGPRYALLRDEFLRLREQVTPRTGPVGRALIFFGGVDAENHTGRAVEALSSQGVEGLHVDVVVGERYPYRDQIELACAKHRFKCHVQTDRMAELMSLAALSIGAGGSATWERCCLGLPAFAICTADNQVGQIAEAASAGLLYSPKIEGSLSDVMTRHLRALLENENLRRSISRNAMQAVDGRGVLRLVSSLGFNGITIRVAGEQDSEKLFQWRNDPSIRAVSRNTGLITWADHQEWFAATLRSPDRLLLIGQRGYEPVGVVRFDIQDDGAEVSIYVVPQVKEAGSGRALLESAERWLAAHHPALHKVRAHVLGANARSHRLFLGADYQLESTCYLKRLHQND